ncbi:hypothetical protein BJ508DRAFT_60947 [Ascobolus immersus RN42]|uniref:Uncharacterized protein n=1 Tax=Ascobolus immersus RN42 TaxID=1160509 RepID=A0A3N4IN03_ASCIM|nr:hypothetical protein BJ508DRAFT_60947 [Ascobolus immersus RN42]
MPTNRPFFSNFLVAFRAHSTVSKTTSSSTSPQKKSPNTTSSTTSSAAASATSAASAATPVNSSPSSTTTQQLPVTPRRRSSSSSRGFEPSSGEKWWIGGRNSDGQERYYRLQPVYVITSPGEPLNTDRTQYETEIFRQGLARSFIGMKSHIAYRPSFARQPFCLQSKIPFRYVIVDFRGASFLFNFCSGVGRAHWLVLSTLHTRNLPCMLYAMVR